VAQAGGQDGRAGETGVDDLVALERRRADSAEQRLRNQTMLFAEAEHKLKTTLAVITGWATTLDESWDKLPDDLRRQGVTAIRRNAEDLAEQAGHLLDDARAEITALDLDPVRLDLAEMLDAMTTLISGVSRAHAVRFDRGDGEAVWAWVDPAALQQVLGHLIENAVKYSPDGGEITVSVRRRDHEAVLEVRDEGVGIPAETNLFAAFQRGEHAEETQGAGLGLYIVRNLVEGMSGRVSARRNDNSPGSTFSVTLPGA
jgi:signal transduction histidine kinase